MNSISPLLPLLVFVAEVCVVTLCTVRIIFVSRGHKVLASILGFFEVTIWLFAIGQIMENLSDVGCYLAFAGGFTLGNYLGIIIERKLAIGTVVVRTITPRKATDLIERLRYAGYGVTSIGAHGATGPVTIIFTVIKRKELTKVAAHIRAFDSQAFYSVDEIKETTAGIFPAAGGQAKDGLRSLLGVLSWAKTEKMPQRLGALYDVAAKDAA
jgi:uncharacterized protein YebE (UPF0316 family)